MKRCPRCGFRDNPNWRGGRFDYNSEYMRFDTAKEQPELAEVVENLQDKPNFYPFAVGETIYYRRGTGGLYLYRVPKEDFRVKRERKNHKKVNK